MSATVNDFNLSYIGNGPSGSGQIISDATPGPKSKTLYGYGVLAAATTLGTTITSSNVGWVDGVATLGRTIVIPIWKVDASDGTNSVYYSVGADSSLVNGDLVTVLGCSVAANNVTAVVVSKVGSDRFSAINSTGTAETGLTQASAKVNRGGIPTLVNVFLSPASTDTNGLATARAAAATYAPVPSAITATGCVLNYSALATSGNSVTVGFVLEFGS